MLTLYINNDILKIANKLHVMSEKINKHLTPVMCHIQLLKRQINPIFMQMIEMQERLQKIYSGLYPKISLPLPHLYFCIKRYKTYNLQEKSSVNNEVIFEYDNINCEKKHTSFIKNYTTIKYHFIACCWLIWCNYIKSPIFFIAEKTVNALIEMEIKKILLFLFPSLN